MTDKTWLCPQLTLTLADGSPLSVPGAVSITSLGRSEVVATVPGKQRVASFTDAQLITGTSDDGLSFEAVGAMAKHTHHNTATNDTRVTFQFREARFARVGAGAVVRREVFLKALQVVGPCSFTENAIQYRLTSLPNDDDRRRGIIRAMLEIEADAPFDHIQTLLSLAQRCKICAPLRKAYDATSLVEIHIVPNETPREAGHPLIPRLGSELAAFMSLAIPAFHAVAGPLELRPLIDYYCLSVEADFGEFKYILASVFMEGFKFYWALNVARLPTDVKANGLIRGFVKGTSATGKPILYNFEELIKNAYANYGLTPTFTFIEDRNALFHTGAPGAHQLGVVGTWPAIEPELITLYRQIDDLLLTLMRYTGPIHRWDTPDKKDTWP